MKLRSVQTPRLRFAVHTHGNPDGMPLLFVHGSYGSARWWQPLFALLPDELYCIAPDLRGCGGSDKPATGYTIEEQAADLAALVDALALDSFDLVAHSSGGAIAVEYVLTHPERARTLTLVNSVPVEGVFTPLEAIALLDRMRTDRELLRRALAALLPRLSAAGDPLFDQLVADAAAMAPAAFTEVAVALNHWNRLRDARALTLPCLLLWGDEDPIVLRDATTRSLIAIPGAANLEVLHGVGHSPMVEAPLLLAERIIDFIAEDFDSYASLRSRALDT